MKPPRFTVRRLIVVVAITAMLVAAVRATNRPILRVVSAGPQSVTWSDGVTTPDASYRPQMEHEEGYPFFNLLSWTDGSRSVQLIWAFWNDRMSWTNLL